MKSFNLTYSKSPMNAMIEVHGPETEIAKLQNYLTITNKSIGYQLMKANERLAYWTSMVSRLDENHLYYNEAFEKKTETYKQVKKLKEELTTEYWTRDDNDRFFIPAGLYFLLGEDHLIFEGDIKPVIPPFLRDYQKEAVEAVLQKKRAIIVAPTGSGKTVILLSICLSMVAAKKRVMVVVPTDFLVGQMYDTIKPYIDSVTAAGGGRKTGLGKDVLITTMQSALKYCDMYDAIIVDEAHFCSTQTIQELFLHAESCEYAYGVTATPFRTDGLDLGIHAFCGPIVFRRTVRWGIEAGWLAEPTIYIRKIPVILGKIHEGSLRASAYKHLAGSSIVIQTVTDQLKKALDQGRKVMVITSTLEVAKKIKKSMENYMKFNIADANYKKPLEDFRKGECNVLVATVKLIGTGVDIPDADTLFVLTQHSSPITTYQSVGRILRKSPNKKDAIVVDFSITKGYPQFESSMKKRLYEYQSVTNNIKILGS